MNWLIIAGIVLVIVMLMVSAGRNALPPPSPSPPRRLPPGDPFLDPDADPGLMGWAMPVLDEPRDRDDGPLGFDDDVPSDDAASTDDFEPGGGDFGGGGASGDWSDSGDDRGD